MLATVAIIMVAILLLILHLAGCDVVSIQIVCATMRISVVAFLLVALACMAYSEFSNKEEF